MAAAVTDMLMHERCMQPRCFGENMWTVAAWPKTQTHWDTYGDIEKQIDMSTARMRLRYDKNTVRISNGSFSIVRAHAPVVPPPV